MRKWCIALLTTIISGYLAEEGDCTPRRAALSSASPATRGPSVDLDALLASVPRGTTWAALDSTIKQTLQEQATRRQAEFNHAWGRRGMKRKLRALRHDPPPALEAQFNLFLSNRYASAVPPDFVATRDIRHTLLLRALQAQYIVSYGVFRGMLRNSPTFRMNDLDWDGVSRFDTAAGIPNRKTLAAQRAFAARALRDLQDIPDGQLTPLEQNVRGKGRHILRALAQHTLESGDGIDLAEAVHYRPQLVTGFALGYSPLGGAFYDDGSALLQDVNAAWFGPTKWVDIATVNTVANFNFPRGALGLLVYIGNPAVNPLAKNYELLASWWLERLEADPRAQEPCTIYSKGERAALWEGFTASSFLDNSAGSSLASLESLTASERELILADYYENVIPAALRTVFPDDSRITSNQRAAVIDALKNDRQIGAFPVRIAAALDSVTGDALASADFNNAMNRLVFIGGVASADQITAGDRAHVAKMWDDVRAFLSRHYSGGAVDFAQVLPTTVIVTADAGSFAHPTTGAIICGLGARRSLGEHYGTLLHEAHHSIMFRTGRRPEGLDLEGIATLARTMLQRQLFAETIPSDAALYALEAGAGVGRLFGATEASIAVLIRDHCDVGEPNSIELAREFGLKWGLTGPQADVVALRANNGTQYLQY